MDVLVQVIMINGERATPARLISFSSGGTDHTFYVRDASGNTMSVYTYSDSLRVSEQYLYGSSRLGNIAPTLNLDRAVPTPVSMPLLSGGNFVNFTRGNKFFELSNHLGNVLVTLSDKKKGVQSGSSGSVLYYLPIVKSANDYYPGGMQMPGRKFGALGRHGFNGKEQDSEVKGEGNSYDFGARIYDPRISRWLSVDPLQRKYPGETPYWFSGGNPIYFLDPDGRDRITTHVYINQNTGEKTIVRVTEYGEIKSKAVQVRNMIDKSDWHWEHEWYDIEQTVTHTMKDGKEVSVATGQETLGKYRTTTNLNLKFYAQWKSSISHNSWGGIAFYSVNGQGQETKKASGNVAYEDIELLLGALDGAKNAAEAEKMYDLVRSVLNANTKMKKAEAVLELVKATHDLSDAAGDLGEKQIEFAESNMPRIEPGKPKQAQFDPNTIMYPYPPNKKGKIDHWHSDSNQTKPLWKDKKSKEPAPKKLGDN